jgi:Fe-S-cluster containining protein
MAYETRLEYIAEQGIEKAEENDYFLRSLKQVDGAVLDGIVHEINTTVSAAIDCTSCGNCCKTLIVNITPEEIKRLAVFMNMPEAGLREKYIEESQQGACYINSIPCHFLDGKKCGIYEQRFTECRDFPHLHKNGFRERLLGTLLHYGSCPIIYNVIEEVKHRLNFFE